MLPAKIWRPFFSSERPVQVEGSSGGIPVTTERKKGLSSSTWSPSLKTLHVSTGRESAPGLVPSMSSGKNGRAMNPMLRSVYAMRPSRWRPSLAAAATNCRTVKFPSAASFSPASGALKKAVARAFWTATSNPKTGASSVRKMPRMPPPRSTTAMLTRAWSPRGRRIAARSRRASRAPRVRMRETSSAESPPPATGGSTLPTGGKKQGSTVPATPPSLARPEREPRAHVAAPEQARELDPEERAARGFLDAGREVRLDDERGRSRREGVALGAEEGGGSGLGDRRHGRARADQLGRRRRLPALATPRHMEHSGQGDTADQDPLEPLVHLKDGLRLRLLRKAPEGDVVPGIRHLEEAEDVPLVIHDRDRDPQPHPLGLGHRLRDDPLDVGRGQDRAGVCRPRPAARGERSHHAAGAGRRTGAAPCVHAPNL